MRRGREVAVAVRDGADLFVLCTLNRSPEGDLYVNYPRGHAVTGWRPHTSSHASGQHHEKSFGNRPFHVRQGPKPDSNFRGTREIATIGVAADEPRAINLACLAADYAEVIELDAREISPVRYRTLLTVDFAEPGLLPNVAPNDRVVHQAILADAWPHVVVRLIDSLV